MNSSLHSEQKTEQAPEADFMHQTRHDIRTAMHVVIGMSNVLGMSDTLPPRQVEMVRMLKANADRALMLIDGMFDYLQSEAHPAFSERKQEESSSPPVLEERPVRQKPYALLVEDYEPNILVTGIFLEELGYDFDVARSGPEALKKFSEGAYDVIIMDVQIPGLDGLETTKRIRTLEKNQHKSPTPILAMTGNATVDDKIFCAKAGMNDYLSKPFESKDLAQKLRSVIASSQASNNIA